eukprot:5453884-Alexandrium_andersonii.AAC.1
MAGSLAFCALLNLLHSGDCRKCWRRPAHQFCQGWFSRPSPGKDTRLSRCPSGVPPPPFCSCLVRPVE